MLSWRRGMVSLLVVLLLAWGAGPPHLFAEGIEDLKKGVVKIIAHGEGQQTKVGTGFIVSAEDDAAYIVTASHVRGGSGNSDSVISGSLASPKPPEGGEPEEHGDEENETESRSDV